MIDSIKKILSVHELKEKIFFTLLMLIVCRIGAFIPVPGINSEEALKIFQFTAGGSQNLLQFFLIPCVSLLLLIHLQLLWILSQLDCM